MPSTPCNKGNRGNHHEKNTATSIHRLPSRKFGLTKGMFQTRNLPHCGITGKVRRYYGSVGAESPVIRSFTLLDSSASSITKNKPPRPFWLLLQFPLIAPC